jgi:ADP-ribose pyrophosphatase YjhB (NUDIX family)
MKIRGKSIVIIRRDDKYLFTKCLEREHQQTYYIPVGGGIEFGERSVDAARREALEETGEEVTNLRLLDISENIFRYNAKDEHEILFTYLADFVNEHAYSSTLNAGLDCDGNTIELLWLTLDEATSSGATLYPPTLPEKLKSLL